ncbi:hypothetical protein BTVI_41314 [Pitangus sulphuratus]|nr:hypothetical protein BTVI_41314 [Pitangus sulphuratus]
MFREADPSAAPSGVTRWRQSPEAGPSLLPGLDGSSRGESGELVWKKVEKSAVLSMGTVLGTPELDAALQVGSHQSGVKGQNHLPHPAAHSAFDAAQDTIGFLGCEHTLMAHVQPLIHQHPQVLASRAAPPAFFGTMGNIISEDSVECVTWVSMAEAVVTTMTLQSTGYMFTRITESPRLEKTSEIIESNL